MLDFIYSPNFLEQMQWFSAAIFVPLVCWYHCFRSTILCRWIALLSGYSVQIGFFLLLDDVGFSQSVLVLLSSLAGYFWITTTSSSWPRAKRKVEREKESAISTEVAAT